MATINIEGATVERIIAGYGFKASSTAFVKGEEKKTWYTIWTKEAVKEGEVLTIEGELSVKLESFTGRDNQPRQTAAIHVNNAMILREDAPF